MSMPIVGEHIPKDEIIYFPKGVKPLMGKDILTKIREVVTEDMGYVNELIEQNVSYDKLDCVFLHKMIDSYLLLQILDKLESIDIGMSRNE